LQARDRDLFTAITDCGAGGLSSAIGEMGEKLGAVVELDRVPLKYAGLRHDEIWISEAQERMVLSVPQDRVAELLKLSADEDVESTVIGQFGTDGKQLILHYRGETVGRLSMAFLHDGVPMPTRRAIVVNEMEAAKPQTPGVGRRERLLNVLASPNVASKHWIIRQYDHEVQGGSVIKPLVGQMQIGPSDAAVVRPKLSSMKGVALGCGLTPQVEDPYRMAIAAIDEAIRNVVCVGASLDRIALLDNFCWPSVDDERTMGTLVRACEACRDAALAFGTPFISGKDSLHNQFTDSETDIVIRIPNTLLISAIGVLDDVRRCVTMDFKNADASILLIAASDPNDLRSLLATHRYVAALIEQGAVAACHDVSDGGLEAAIAEMCIASGLGATITASTVAHDFEERPGQYIVELRPVPEIRRPDEPLVGVTALGHVHSKPQLTIGDANWSLDELTAAWRGTLDW
ncbi:MAG: phosphoribosylformylglycinamidine synthase, partial [Phycisphaerae bacterium]|nr:phosphoribosylformylglycinamidine synthase [Phycisphaerae bacterium]